MVTALAQASCRECHGGLRLCPLCVNLNAPAPQVVICETCLGFGTMPCGICDGTDWASVDDLKPPLHASVMLERLTSTLAHAKDKLSVSANIPLLHTTESAMLPVAEWAQVLRRLEHAGRVAVNAGAGKQLLHETQQVRKNVRQQLVYALQDLSLAWYCLSHGDDPAARQAAERFEHFQALARSVSGDDSN